MTMPRTSGMIGAAFAAISAVWTASAGGFGGFGEPAFLPTDAGGQQVALADLDGDDDLDIVELASSLAAGNPGSISVLLNNVDGTFGAATTHPVGSVLLGLDVGDVNNDGALDITVASQDFNETVGTPILFGNGDGTFQEPVNQPSPDTTPQDVALADVTGDGNLDLIVVGFSPNAMTVRAGDGAGNFGPATVIEEVGSFPQSVTLGDFDNDGDLDAASANLFGNNVSIMLNDGAGAFGEPVNTDAGSNPVFVTNADVNNDGSFDLAVGATGSDTLEVLLGNGDGSFQLAQSFATGLNPSTIDSADLDGNGDLDLLVSTPATPSVSIHFNDGAGSFENFESVFFQNKGEEPQGLAVGDLDDDGDADLVIAVAESVGVLLNQTASAGEPADLNSDGVVDGADLGLLLGQWGTDGPADLNDDGVVDGADLGLLLGAWGPTS